MTASNPLAWYASGVVWWVLYCISGRLLLPRNEFLCAVDDIHHAVSSAALACGDVVTAIFLFELRCLSRGAHGYRFKSCRSKAVDTAVYMRAPPS